jgi:PAS domain S-box-containing protein
MSSPPALPPPRVSAGVLADPARLALASRLLAASDASPGLAPLAELAAELLGAKAAQVTLLLGGEVVAVAGHGADPDSPADVTLCAMTVQQGRAFAVADIAADPVVASAASRTAAYLGVPLLDPDGTPLGALCVYDDRPRSWSAGQARLLERLARSAVAELELRAVTDQLRTSAARLDLALEAASIGSFDLVPATGRLSWDGRLQQMFGYDETTFVPDMSSFEQRVHPDDLARVLSAVDGAVANRGELTTEYRIVLPDGTARWVAARGRVVVDDAGELRLVGAAYDTTAAQDGRQRVARVLETMTDAFFSLDEDWRFTYVNAQAERVLVRTRDELLGQVIWDEFPDAVGDTAFWHEYHRAMETGETVSFEEHYPEPLAMWFEVRAWRTPDGLSVYFHDVSARRQAEREREAAVAAREQTALDWQRAAAEATDAQERLALLADITRALVSTLDVDESMRRLAELVVPRLADWAAVTLVDDEGRLRHSVARHRDAARDADVAHFAELQTRVANARSNSRRVAASGQPVLHSAFDLEAASAGWEGDELTVLLRRLGCATTMAVPLQGRDTTLGVLVLAGGPDRAAFTEDDLATATELGQRAGLAVQNALLYTRQATVAEALQRSLLTPLPEPDHLEMAARYLPASQLAQVGGDFYWASQQPDGATVMAIGDVMGHDLSATAAMGQVQNLLRGIAFDSQDTPAGVLRRVDAALLGLRVDTLATAVVARIEQEAQDAAGGLRRLRWSNAGHPPPVVLRADGTVEVLEHEADLLLGLEPATSRSDAEAVLRPGDTVLLHTDGLVERRGRPIARGQAELAGLLADRQDVPLGQLCDLLLTGMLDGPPEDDVALLAVRTHPEDRPRPPEAGPATA